MNIFIYTYLYLFTYTYLYIYIHIYMYIHTYIYMYTYTYDVMCGCSVCVRCACVCVYVVCVCGVWVTLTYIIYFSIRIPGHIFIVCVGGGSMGYFFLFICANILLIFSRQKNSEHADYERNLSRNDKKESYMLSKEPYLPYHIVKSPRHTILHFHFLTYIFYYTEIYCLYLGAKKTEHADSKSELWATTRKSPTCYLKSLIFCKRALQLVALLRKEICNLRYLMQLRHPACTEPYFAHKSPTIIGSFAQRDLQLKASYASSPPCI